MTGPPAVPGRDLNPGPLSFEASALPTELTRPDENAMAYWDMLWLTGICYGLLGYAMAYWDMLWLTRIC